ncbi:MAG: transcriptional regulator [Acidimicrobiales bacterium]|nr:transcriptional regulator [Acidimicrobiales bacterium]
MNEHTDDVDPLFALRALAEPKRRALYDYVVAAGTWVGRDEAADATGLQRGLSAHHLDRLALDGLLEVDYQRLSGRTGPGAGRPAKVYRRTRRDFSVTLPPRHYEYAGRILADAIVEAQTSGRDVSDTVAAAARAAGRQLGAAIRQRVDETGSSGAGRAVVLDVLREHGFEPEQQDDGVVRLRNCPFHQLAQRQTDLICGMNHLLIDAALTEANVGGFNAVLQPDPDTCCVHLTNTANG